MAVALLLAWLAYSCIVTCSMATSNTTESVPVTALLDLLYVTDQSCDDFAWCSIKKGNRKSDRRGLTSIGQWHGPCSCDVTCLANGTCCPDFRLSKLMQGKVFTNVSEFASNISHNATLYNSDVSIQHGTYFDDVKQCVVSGLRSSTEYLPLPYYRMVTVCLITNTSLMLRQKCEMRHNITDTQKRALEDYLPVQSLVSGTVYRNKHCLLCSTESDSQYEEWSVYFVSRKVKEPMLLEYAFEKVAILNAAMSGFLNVDLVFEPEDELKQHFPQQTCFNIDVNTCVKDNETDHSLLDIACRSFPYPVFTKRPGKETEPSVMFNNLACYQCNGGGSHLKYGESCKYAEQIPFALKMQYKGVERQQYGGLDIHVYVSLQCGEGRVFDAKKNTCRDVYCPCGMIAENGYCVPVFAAVSSKLFKTYIHIKSQTHIQNTDVMMKYEQTLFHHFNEVFDVGSNFTLKYFLLYRGNDSRGGADHALCIIFAGRDPFVSFMDMLAYLTKSVRGVRDIGHNGETFAINLAILDTFHFNSEYAYDETTGRMFIPVEDPLPKVMGIESAIRIRECHFCYRVEATRDDIKKVGRSIVLKETGVTAVQSMFSYLNYTDRILLCKGKVIAISSNDSNNVHDKIDISSSAERNDNIKDNSNAEEKGMVGVIVFVVMTMCIVGVCIWRKGQRDSAKSEREIELAQVNENRDETDIGTK